MQSSALPTISVITPSFEQAEFLPRCIASVQSQTYVPLEHRVYDPGSTDGSREIAAAASSVLLIAEPDDGQSDAIARGCRDATGDIIAWVNSDDWYAGPDVFAQVAQRFAQPDRPDVVYGRGYYEAPDGSSLGHAYIFEDATNIAARLTGGVGVLQPAVFVRRQAMAAVSGPDTTLNYAMDYDLWVRLALAGHTFAFVDECFAGALIHPDAKTEDGSGGSLREAIDVAQKHFGFVSWTWAFAQAEVEVLGAFGVVKPEPTEVERVQIAKRAQNIFDGYNRNARTVLRLVRPPWDRPSLSALSHLVRRVRS